RDPLARAARAVRAAAGRHPGSRSGARREPRGRSVPRLADTASRPDNENKRRCLRMLTRNPGGFRDHFASAATDYAAFRPRYPAALFAALAESAPGRHVAWDCATGSGQAAIGLAGHFEQVVATDASAAQLSAALAHPRVRYREAPADASGLPPRSVELVTVAQALHWLDRTSFYA